MADSSPAKASSRSVSRYIFIVVYMFLCEIGCKGTKKIAYMQKKLNEDEKKRVCL